jgi:hypothetical protein
MKAGDNGNSNHYLRLFFVIRPNGDLLNQTSSVYLALVLKYEMTKA